MVGRDEAELVRYLAEYGDRARLVLRDAFDPGAALHALRGAADAVWRIPHPIEPESGLPNWCDAELLDGVPLLHLDVKDGSPYAERITTAILTALDAEGIDGRLEPVWPERSDEPVEIPPEVIAR